MVRGSRGQGGVALDEAMGVAQGLERGDESMRTSVIMCALARQAP